MIQKDFLNIGNSGCYFLCICHAFGAEDNEVYGYYKNAVRLGYMDEECFIKNPGAIVEMITGHYVAVRKSSEEADANAKIAYFYNPSTKLHHFVVKEKDGSWWDPYGESRTRKEGYVESWRLFV